ncbi:phospholipase [Bradyrhizobium manausense]|uniref:alpha/beta hydrolase n=1 Tax=Bradyrhizobium manausense TaxID=989370 RepID=UPI001BAD0E2C|nr:alpha/beta hydrolase-fold protein [Bradyrhizobium manausense]MBR0684300.1 phospholipase [Bradyrhizobium manausense]
MDKTTEGHRNGALLARPGHTTLPSRHQGGFHPVTASGGQKGMVFVPELDNPATRLPLAVVLHGASGIDGGLVEMTVAHARSSRMIVIAPKSKDTSWDILRGGYGPDVTAIDEMLGWTMSRHPVDPERIAISGFSDGGSYALSLGLMNGELFSHVLAFSPGFTMHKRREGQPQIFICHGLRDDILPIEPCGRSLGQRMRAAGYNVDYCEFDDGHVVPREMVNRSMSAFLAHGAGKEA